jgi:hypothetical protein
MKLIVCRLEINVLAAIGDKYGINNNYNIQNKLVKQSKGTKMLQKFNPNDNINGCETTEH